MKRQEGYTPCKAAAAYCRSRCRDIAAEARESGRAWAVWACPQKKCPLWRYRQGKNPGRAGIGGRPKAKHAQ
jgi:hypothetical protein